MKRFALYFIIFFLLIWLLEATAAGSPRQSLPELWERFTSYQLRHHLLDFPYIVIIAFFLALPDLLNKVWMSWNALAIIFLYKSSFLLAALIGVLHSFLAPPLNGMYGFDVIGSEIGAFQSAFFVYPGIVMLSLWRGKTACLVLLIALGNYVAWYGCSMLLVLAHHMLPLYWDLEVYALALFIFFTINALLLAIVLPLVLHRRMSQEEKEWKQHVHAYRREKCSFNPMHIPSLPAPPLPNPPSTPITINEELDRMEL